MPTEVARAETTVDAPPEQVWSALTTPATLKRFFFGSDVSAEWRVGGPIRFRGEWQGRSYEDKGTIQVFEPPKRLAYSHFSPMSGAEDRPVNYHLVTYTLRTAPGGGTTVLLTQERHDDAPPPTAQARAEFAKNWAMVLDGLKRVVES